MTREDVQQLTDRLGKDIESLQLKGQIKDGQEVPWNFWFTNALIEQTQGQVHKCKDVLQAMYWRVVGAFNGYVVLCCVIGQSRA